MPLSAASCPPAASVRCWDKPGHTHHGVLPVVHRQPAAHSCILQATLKLPAEVVAGISKGLLSYQGWIDMRHPQQSGALDSHQSARWQTGQAVHQLQDVT